MKVVVVGATGNVGTSILRSLQVEDSVDSIVGIARRRPQMQIPKTRWEVADVTRHDLESLFRGADAVVHLAWAIQPSHQPHVLSRINLVGSERVFTAVAKAGVPNLIYASSIGAYSPGPKEPVDESWPTGGIWSSFYSRHKALVERMLDSFEEANPHTRVVRLRKALVFKGDLGSGARRLFLGPLFPNAISNPKLIPVIPDVAGIKTQAVHSHDVGEAYRLALVSDVRGPFNIAADPPVDSKQLARILGARTVPFPASWLRALTKWTWKAHLHPTEPGWLDQGLLLPLMDTTRARTELGWTPQRTADEAVRELLEGLRKEQGLPTPPLDPATSGPLRKREMATGIGEVSGVQRERE